MDRQRSCQSPAASSSLSRQGCRKEPKRSRQFRVLAVGFSHQLLPENRTPSLRRRVWKEDRLDAEGFLRMSPDYAMSYMSRLASVISDADRVTAYTDLRWGQDIVIDRFVDTDNVGQNEARLATLAIGTVRFGSNVTLAQAIRFRGDHYDELKRYRKAVHDLVREVAGVGSENAQEREMQRIVRDEFKPAHEGLTAKLVESGVDFGINVLQATGAASIGATFGGISGAVAGWFFSFGVSSVRWRTGYNRVRRERPMTYLVELRKRFNVAP